MTDGFSFPQSMFRQSLLQISRVTNVVPSGLQTLNNIRKIHPTPNLLAEAGGFEPPRGLLPNQFSRLAP